MEKRSKAETEQLYQELVAEQEKSGLTIRAFAEKRGIPTGTLSFWRHHLRKRDGAGSRGDATTTTAKPAFVPVSVVEAQPSVTGPAAVEPKPLSPKPPAGQRAGYEVVLGRDRVLRLPADFDEARVAALVRAVTSC